MRNRVTASLGSSVFLVLAPGIVAGVLPRWMTGWRMQPPWLGWSALRLVGVLLLGAGVLALLHAFGQFIVEGTGTPAPVAPTEQLVVGGLYRHVRNPMYLAVAATLVGQALLLGQPSLLLYAAGFVVISGAFVRWYEEPTLRRRFGEPYEAYCRAVPGWWPRLRAWQPGQQ